MRLLLVASLTIFAACTVGDPDPGPGTGDDDSSVTPDGGGDPGPGPDGGDVACIPGKAPNGDGNHNEGQPCLTCHREGNGPPPFTVAGTLFASKTGGSAVTGATMIVVDGAGTEVELVTASNGNFYTNQAVTFPLTVKASKCPDEKQMTGKPQTGDCNGCHTQTAAQGRIHLP